MAAPRRAHLTTFAGVWVGHTRELRIARDGRATEAIGDGCCDPVLNVTFRLSHPGGTPENATAVATVTGVWVRDRSVFGSTRPPRVGERRTIRLRNGVIDDTLTGTTYCSSGVGTCGA